MAATLKTEVVQNPSSATVNLTLDASGGVAAGQNLSVTGTTTLTGAVTLSTNATSSGTVVMSSPYTMRNKIINGAMVIDQRNAGASVTMPTYYAYTLDRWLAYTDQSSKFSVQQNAGSVTPPTAFKNYLGITSLSSYTVGVGEIFAIWQAIEGYNIADLAWGTASAQTVTLSFWVRSSLTGTFGGGLRNSGGTRSYPFSYTISAANTWEYKTITIPGDTTGTWLSTNGIGVYVQFGLGVGATYSGAAGAWSGNNYISATGATSVVGTNGATFYITGVQLERGTVATPFEYRNYQQELAMCMRYYESSLPAGTAPSNGANTTTMVSNAVNITPVAAWGGTTPQNTNIRFAVPKRATPTMTTYGNSQGYWGYLTSGATLPTNQNTYTFSANVNAQSADTNSLYVNQQVSQSILWGVAGNWAASAEL